jgi:hypothetical protein
MKTSSSEKRKRCCFVVLEARKKEGSRIRPIAASKWGEPNAAWAAICSDPDLDLDQFHDKKSQRAVFIEASGIYKDKISCRETYQCWDEQTLLYFAFSASSLMVCKLECIDRAATQQEL